MMTLWERVKRVTVRKTHNHPFYHVGRREGADVQKRGAVCVDAMELEEGSPYAAALKRKERERVAPDRDKTCWRTIVGTVSQTSAFESRRHDSTRLSGIAQKGSLAQTVSKYCADLIREPAISKSLVTSRTSLMRARSC